MMTTKNMTWMGVATSGLLALAACGKTPEQICAVQKDLWTRCGSAAEKIGAEAVDPTTCAAEIRAFENRRHVDRVEAAATCVEGKSCDALAHDCDTALMPPTMVQKRADRAVKAVAGDKKDVKISR